MTPEERGNRIALRQKPDDNLANRGGIIRAIQDAIAAEREACASLATEFCVGVHDSGCPACDAAAAIRART